jgi:iron uptake system EfeUOB component EfeO/EfeM
MNKRVFHLNSKQVKINAIQAVKEIMGEDDMDVTIEPHREDKSAEMRGFWHFLLGVISQETGYTKEEVKELVKKALLGTKTIKIGSIEKEVTESSEAQAKPSYSELIEGTYRIAAEAGITLPPARYNG